MSEFDPDKNRSLSQPPRPSEGGKRMGCTDPFALDKARTGDDAVEEYLEGTDFTPEEFDNLPPYLRRQSKKPKED